jgi:predicted RNA-binding Zn-ribbon protein involved in translation (DUF1610 family)
MRAKTPPGGNEPQHHSSDHKQDESEAAGKDSRNGAKRAESAHVCPKCGARILLEEMGLRETTTGILTCPKCDWSGKIDIKIVGGDSDS